MHRSESPGLNLDNLDQITALTYCPTNNSLISGHKNGEVKIWENNNESLTEKTRFFAYTKAIIALLATEDGKLVTASNDTIQIWDANYCIQTINNIGTILCLTAPPDATWFAAIIHHPTNGKCIYIHKIDGTYTKLCPMLDENYPILTTTDKLLYVNNKKLVALDVNNPSNQPIGILPPSKENQISKLAIFDYNCLAIVFNHSQTFINQGGSVTSQSCKFEFYNLQNNAQLSKTIPFDGFHIHEIYPCSSGIIVVTNKNRWTIIDARQKANAWCNLPLGYCDKFGFIGLADNKLAYVEIIQRQYKIVVLQLSQFTTSKHKTEQCNLM